MIPLYGPPAPENIKHSPYGERNQLLKNLDDEQLYDTGRRKTPGLGGTTTLVYDTRSQKLEKHFLSLSGTPTRTAREALLLGTVGSRVRELLVRGRVTTDSERAWLKVNVSALTAGNTQNLLTAGSVRRSLQTGVQEHNNLFFPRLSDLT